MHTKNINFGAIGDGRGFQDAIELHDFLFNICKKYPKVYFRFNSENQTSMEVETFGEAISEDEMQLEAFRKEVEVE